MNRLGPLLLMIDANSFHVAVVSVEAFRPSPKSGPPVAHELNVPTASGTVTQSPTDGSRELLAHAWGTEGVRLPMDAPIDGPGYVVTDDGVHDCVTGAT